MGTTKDNEDKIFIAILEQNWTHLRHVESQRMWFTNIFALVVAGVLSFLGTRSTPSLSSNFAVIAFLWFFSVLGLLQTLKTNKEIDVLLNEIHVMCELKGLKRHVDFPELRSGIYGRIRIRYIYVAFYSLMILFFSYLLFTTFPPIDC